VLKGEFVLMIAKGDPVAADALPIETAFDQLIEAGMPRMDAMKALARERGLSKREVYEQLNRR
jgi:16S rRNA C1402 (ribose-2'-O) methylase RsmI